MSQVGMNIRGNSGKETTVMLDGIQLNGACGNGSTQAYTNTQSYDEMVFQTSGAGADVSSPGVQQNMIPRQGGNQTHGSFNGVYSNKNWQADDLTPELDRQRSAAGQQLVRAGRSRGRRGRQVHQGQAVVVQRCAPAIREQPVARHALPGRQSGHSTTKTCKNLSLRLTSQGPRKNKAHRLRRSRVEGNLARHGRRATIR
jgi:hypothetical protein